MSSKQEPLRIAGWQNGIGDSPHVGLGVIRNADIESFPGAVKVGLKPQSMFSKINTVTFTAVAATNLCTASGDIESNGVNFRGAAVYFTTTGTLPAGLSAATTYYLYYQSATTFKVCTSYANSVGSTAGTVIDITDTGTGVHTMNTIAIGTINWIIQDPRSEYYYLLSSNGRVWFAGSDHRAYLLNNSAIDTPASGVTNANGNGLIITPFSSTTSTYLFVFRNALIDVIDVFGDTAIEALAWSNAWKNLNTGAGTNNTHHAIFAQDQAIYFCDDRYVGSIIENAGFTFAPGTAGTFTYNSQALDLPPREIAQCLEELGTDLLIGGNTFNLIYPWDRLSNSYGIPIVVPERSIKRMKNIGGQVYILPSSYGNIYMTQGSYVKFVRKLPTHIVNNVYDIESDPITWGGIAESNGSLLFGIVAVMPSASGVWKLFPDGRLVHYNVPSTGAAQVAGLYAKGTSYLMGYSGGADSFLNSVQYSANYETVLQSELRRVGTKTHKATYSELEVQTATPASSGNIRIGYRTDKISSFTTIATFTMDSSSTSFKADVGTYLTNLENLQVQIEMQGNPEFMEVILYP